MTRIGILTISDKHDNFTILSYFKKLEKKYNAKVYIIDPKYMAFKFSDPNAKATEEERKTIIYRTKPLKLDVILPRIDSDVSINNFMLSLNAMDYFRNHTDIPIINYTKGMLISNDKFWQGEFVASYGYLTPKTVLISSAEEIQNVLKEFKTYPLVIKSQFGAGGAGVGIVESERSAKSVISSMILNGSNVVIQEYLPVKGGTDYRLFVIGGKVIRGIIRTAPKKDFRANVALGGSKTYFEPSKELQNVAIDIANIIGLEVAAVDFMYYKNKFYFIEINKNPGTKNDPKTAEKLFAYAIERSKKKIKKIKEIKKSFTINSLKDVSNVFTSLDADIFSITSKAFRRLIPAFFINRYGILSYEYTNDQENLKKYTRVRFMQEKDIDYINYNASVRTKDLIDYGSVENYLRKFSDVHFMIYRRNDKINNVIKRRSYSLALSNTTNTVEKFNNDVFFRKFLDSLGIKSALYKNFPYNEFINKKFSDLKNIFGLPFVIDLSSESSEARKDTFIIKNELNFKHCLNLILRQKYWNQEIKEINITKYLPGIPVSINACITKYGVFTGSLQQKIIDIPEVYNTKSFFKERNCGAISSNNLFPEQIIADAKKLAVAIGKAMHRQHKYRGTVLLDFIYNQKTHSITPVGCYPSITQNTVIESMSLLNQKLIPFDAWQYLESFNIKYSTNFERIQKIYDKAIVNYSYISLYNRKDKHVKLKNNLASGIYEYNRNGKIKFVSPGLTLSEITGKNQFIITESISSTEKDIYLEDDNTQFMTLIFPEIIIDNNNSLKPTIKKTIQNIYTFLGI